VVFNHELLDGHGCNMTLIRFQNGKPIMVGGKIGTEPECCCGGRCCQCTPGMVMQTKRNDQGDEFWEYHYGQSVNMAIYGFVGLPPSLREELLELINDGISGFVEAANGGGYKCVSVTPTYNTWDGVNGMLGATIAKGRCCGTVDTTVDPIWTGELPTGLYFGAPTLREVWRLYPCVGPYAYDECIQTTQENCCPDFDFDPTGQCVAEDPTSVCPEINNFP
jgi:hypothetical protein